MAERRMFAKCITESDAFLDMPLSTQALYFHLGMLADDDGFIGSPKKIMRSIGASEDDLKILIAKRFILGFESGIVVMKHWKMNNYIQKDRYKKTVYQDEMKTLQVKNNGSYTELDTECIQNVYTLDTQVRLGKDRIGKDRIYIDNADVDIEEVLKFYESEIGLATSTTATVFESYLEDLPKEMIIKAIEIASSNNKKSLSYIKGILNSWMNKGYKVLADTEQEHLMKNNISDIETRVKEALYGREGFS